GDFPDWLVQKHESFIEDGGALLSIRSTDPDLLKDIDPSRVALANKASAQAMTKFQEYVMNDKVTWSIISIPTGDWAQKVFPELSREEAIASLWDEIIKIVRVDKDSRVEDLDAQDEGLRTDE